MKILKITVNDAAIGERADKFLSAETEYTRSYIAKLADEGFLCVNGKSVKVNYKLREGDVLELNVPEVAPYEVTEEEIPLDIVYEDEHILAVNKPQGMVVHPAAGNYSGTLVNALMHHCKGKLSGINGVARPGIVHRIDKDTSGVLLVAKTNAAHLHLAEQIKVHSVTRKYVALVHGHFKEPEGTVDAPIGRNPKDRKKMCVTSSNSKNAITHYKVLEEFRGYSLVECRLETGRTHQIRVHMSHLGHPVAADPVYGPKKDALGKAGQLLHAEMIGFIHPESGKYMELCAPLPPEFLNILDKFHKMGNNL